MAKVRTLSRTFMKGHPKAGQPTYFVEKFHQSIRNRPIPRLPKDWEFSSEARATLFRDLSTEEFEPKGHTIRMGRHFKENDKLTVSVWSGKPYRSKQIKLWSGNIIVVDILISVGLNDIQFLIDDIDYLPINKAELAKNDGLSLDDFMAWFSLPTNTTHQAQILIWDPEINY